MYEKIYNEENNDSNEQVRNEPVVRGSDSQSTCTASSFPRCAPGATTQETPQLK